MTADFTVWDCALIEQLDQERARDIKDFGSFDSCQLGVFRNDSDASEKISWCAESDRAPEIGRALDSSGREANQKALIELIRKAQAQRLVAAGDPDILAGRYFGVLVGGSRSSYCCVCASR